jgi:hypothetical protein
MDESKVRKIRDHLSNKNVRCPLCHGANWTVFEDLVSPTCIDLEYKRAIEGKMFPLVALICSGCGYVCEIAAGPIGLL